MQKIIILVMVLIPTFAQAGRIFSIDDRQTGFATGPNAAAINASLSGLADSLETEVNNLLPESSRAVLSENGADANVGIALALNGDRTNTPPNWMVAFGGQAAIKRPSGGGTTSGANRIPDVGVGAQASIAISAKASGFGFKNIGPLDADRLLLTLSGLALSHETENVSVDFWNFGINARYHLVPMKEAPFVIGWNGVFARIGANYARTTALYKSSLSATRTTTVSGGGGDMDMSIAMDYALGLKSSQVTIPLELSTSITALSFFSVYGGGSMDIAFGSTGLTGTGTGPVSTTASSDPSMKIFEGTANLNLDDADASRSPAFASFRAFTGVEIKLPYFRIGAEYTVLSTGAWGLAAIGKFVF
jgi:hypothetical protein